MSIQVFLDLIPEFDRYDESAICRIECCAKELRALGVEVKALKAEAIERCAKVCESVYESYESKCDTWPEARPDALSGAEDCIRAICALKEGK